MLLIGRRGLGVRSRWWYAVGHGSREFAELLAKDLALCQGVALASGVKVE
jgi:hypothetical protein